MIKNKINFFYFILSFLFVSGNLSAQLSSVDLNGYIKYLFTSLKTPLLYHDRLNDNLIHGRLNTRWFPTRSLTLTGEFRFRGFYGGSVEHLPVFRDQIRNNYDFSHLDLFVWENDRSLGYAETDRLNIDYINKNIQVTIGRQRIAWGTSLVWNITDLFNPKSVLEFDYEELPGADAIRLQFYTGAVSRLELVVKPGTGPLNRTWAGLWTVNHWGYDWFLIAGSRNNRKLTGGGWAGDIAGGGFRGEFILSEPVKKIMYLVNPGTGELVAGIGAGEKTVVSFVISGDFTFANTLYFHTELLYNNIGKQNLAGVYQLQAVDNGLLSPARWSIFQEISKDITPLLRGSLFVIYNPDDLSAIIVPSLSWSVITNWDATFLGYISSGKNWSEFGDAGDLLFARLRYSF